MLKVCWTKALLAVGMVSSVCAAAHAAESARDFETNGRPGLQIDEGEALCRSQTRLSQEGCLAEFRIESSQSIPGDTVGYDYADEYLLPAKPRRQIGSFTTLECDQKRSFPRNCDENSKYFVASPGFFLRRNHTQFRAYSTKFGTRLDSEGARFEFANDLQNSNKIYSAAGAIMYPFYQQLRQSQTPEEGPFIRRAAIIPSVEFDYQNNSSNSDQDVNSLTFRLGTDLYLRRFPLFAHQHLWLNATLDTDFHFESATAAFEAEWRPSAIKWGIGFYQPVPGLSRFEIDYAWQPSMRFEAGKVLSEGVLPSGFSYARAGAGVEIKVRLAKIGKFYFDWHHYEGLSKSSKTDQRLRAGFEYYPIPGNQNFALDLEYIKGDLPIKLTDQEKLSLGLSVKF